MTKKSPVSATNVHVSIVGHITRDEFRRYFRTTEAANGFANRFLLACTKRSKALPFGGQLDPGALEPLVQQLEDVVAFVEALAPNDAEVHLGPDARARWAEVYPSLSEGRDGMVGAITARAEAQALRLAAVYAVLDKTLVVSREHLEAALAIVGYAEESARYVFDDVTGDTAADDILDALRRNPAGMTRTELRDLFGRNRSGNDIGRALALLQRGGVAIPTIEPTGGRHGERWRAAAPARDATTKTTETTKVPLRHDDPPSVVNVVSVVPCSFNGEGIAS